MITIEEFVLGLGICMLIVGSIVFVLLLLGAVWCRLVGYGKVYIP